MRLAEIAEEADEEIQYMKDSLKNELKASNQNMSDEARQEILKQKSREAIKILQERLDRNFEKNSNRKKTRTEELIEQQKIDTKSLHEEEVSLIKQRLQQKTQIEKERMASMNMQLLEESGDIDQ